MDITRSHISREFADITMQDRLKHLKQIISFLCGVSIIIMPVMKHCEKIRLIIQRDVSLVNGLKHRKIQTSAIIRHFCF